MSEELSIHDILHTRIPGKHTVKTPLSIIEENIVCKCKKSDKKVIQEYNGPDFFLFIYYKLFPKYDYEYYKLNGNAYFNIPVGSTLVRPYNIKQGTIYTNIASEYVRSNNAIFKGLKSYPPFITKEIQKECECSFFSFPSDYTTKEEKVKVNSQVSCNDDDFEDLLKGSGDYFSFKADGDSKQYVVFDSFEKII